MRFRVVVGDRMIFHFSFENWFQLIRLASREKQIGVRLYFLSILLIAVPLVSTFHAICFFLDGILFPGLWKTEIKEPIFVVGHARSGTTLVHRLLSADEGRFSVFLLYEMYFPSLLQKKVIRGVAAFDRKFLGGMLERRVRAWEDKHYAAVRKVHQMGLTEAEEDDIVLYYSLASGFWITKMPYMGDIDFYSVDKWSEKKRWRLMGFYKECVRRQIYLNGGDKVHLSKNPVFAGRVAALIETFPDARIVTTMRNPYETIPSLLKLLKSSWRRMGWEDERTARCLRFLANQSFETYMHPLEVLENSPATRGAVVDYREATTDVSAAIQRLYGDLGMEMSDEYRAYLDSQGKRENKHRSGHTYSLEEFGLEADEIRTRLSVLFDRFDWDADASPPADPT
ncbi:MAG: sulfotransferase [Candidatus Binatia bacterium]|nr:sulfotransferase [Candidatus Binatia bacterium]